MSTTTPEAPALGASELTHISEILNDFVGGLLAEDESLTPAEAEAIIRDRLERAPIPPRIAPRRPRACQCARPLEFELGHCLRCGLDLGRPR